MTTRAASGPLPAGGWRWAQVLQEPHRLGFLLAMAVLGAAGGWWLLVQLARAGWMPALPWTLPPSLVHAALMTFGFMPLFFTGFLFTAGPRWLHVPPPAARQLLPALGAQAAGWLLWLAGAHLHAAIALAGLVLATGGLTTVTLRFWRLLRASREPDRLHAKLAGCALAAGCACLAGTALALAAGAPATARAFVLSGLWTCVVGVYVSVAHRMIPFFSGELPGAASRDRMLPLMLAMVVFEAAAVWLEPLLADAAPWLLLRGLIELAAGAWVLKLARAWGVVRSLKIRLLAMLHLGLLWLGVAWALSGISQLLAAFSGAPVLPLAALHALTMGCLGSLMLAMVTRVSCGRSGRAEVADHFTWSLFWLLQLAVLLRIAGAAAAWTLPLAAALWAGVMLSWGIRLGNWYGRGRADGRPG